jgi:hypothetical protein
MIQDAPHRLHHEKRVDQSAGFAKFESLRTDTAVAALPLETKAADNATDLRQARAR